MVAKDMVVSFNYTLRDKEGQLIESSQGHPLAYLHGHHNIIPGLERALAGLKPGDSKRVEVAAVDAYGTYNPDLRIEIPVGQFGGGAPPEGALVNLRSQEGHTLQARVARVEAEMVHLDANHPLAGQDLVFEVEIVGVRPATAEEIRHGHAHGEGGHHH
ncbi:MAG TPA: peptidylprolyl isomerase [Candidatus Nitrosotenuis sp.]|jgi:FKBP-type peptidyl-prolyl cis-trans isomerase SlyD|nr:peptidylprolyl isomerase [Candidatus Nitrosotenuis sp.]